MIALMNRYKDHHHRIVHPGITYSKQDTGSELGDCDAISCRFSSEGNIIVPIITLKCFGKVDFCEPVHIPFNPTVGSLKKVHFEPLRWPQSSA
jgi:hypothetical protein